MWTRTKANNGVSRVLPILVFSFVFIFQVGKSSAFIKEWIIVRPACQKSEVAVEVEFLYNCTEGILLANYTLPLYHNTGKNETWSVATIMVWRHWWKILRIVQSRQNCYLSERRGKSKITCFHNDDESVVAPINFILLVDVRHLHHGRCEGFQNLVSIKDRLCIPLKSKFVTIPSLSRNARICGWTLSHLTSFIGFSTLASIILTIYCRF